MKRIKVPDFEKNKLARITADGRPAFVKGGVKPEGSGRKKGQRNRHNVIIKDCMLTAMEMVGSNNRGKDGAEGYMAFLAWQHPEIFGRLLEKVIPFSLSGAGGGPVQVEYSNREEIILRMKERGLPIPPNLLAPPKRRQGADAPIDAQFTEVAEED